MAYIAAVIALGTAFFLVFALGLTVEAVLAWTRLRILPTRDLVLAGGMGVLGVATVLTRSVGSGHDHLRQFSGWAVLVTFVACLLVDFINRRRKHAHLEHA